MLEVSIQLRESSGLYFAKAPSADAAGNVVAVTTRFLPDACPMVTHAISSEAATADCAGRKTKLDFAVPLELFNCSAYVLDDFFRWGLITARYGRGGLRDRKLAEWAGLGRGGKGAPLRAHLTQHARCLEA